MDSGASHHMSPSREVFPSLCSTSTSSIEVGDSSHNYMKGKGDIPILGSHILDILLIPNLSSKLLSIYDICNIGGWMTILFTIDYFDIRSLQEPQSLFA